MARICAICTSAKKGTQKSPVDAAELRPDWGIVGDAHAGHWHRQVSLISREKIEAFQARGVPVTDGAFGENLIVDGLDCRSLPVGTRLKIGPALLEVTQIGKACHDHCAIYQVVGDCIMPREGIFTKVLEGGTITVNDSVEVLPVDPDSPFTAAVITLSDRCHAGEREDRSGPEIVRILTEHGYEVVEQLLLPDGLQPLEAELIRLADQRQVNVIFTTGGTGFAARDLTPEATTAVCDRMAPGISGAILCESLKITPHAMLSRQVSGIRKQTLIINLPGSPKACREDLDIVLPALEHGLGILRGTADD